MSDTSIKEYFNSLAKKRKKRRISAYYWNEISNYTKYFSHEDASVLEIGCGSGDLLAKIDGKRKVGIDISEEFISWAKEKNELKIVFQLSEKWLQDQ